VKKFWKKILTTFCALILSVVLLSGCSWLKIDEFDYYNQVVATVGTKEFYKKDLLEAFSSYGYQYYQQGQMSLEESVKQTITSMIDRELLMDEVKATLGKLDPKEEAQIRKEAYDYMQDSIFTHEEKIRKELDSQINIEEDTSSSAPLRATKEEYAPKTEYVDGQVVRIKETKEKVFADNLTEHFTKSNQIITDEKVSSIAWARYVNALQDGAKAEGRSTKEADVLLHEENRLIELLTDNYYLEKYEEAFFDRTPVDTATVLAYYREQYKKAQSTYADIDEYHTAMQNASSEYIYYHPTNPDNDLEHEYVNVKHILIKFSEDQTAELTSLKKEYGGSDEAEVSTDHPLYDEYLDRCNDVVSKTRTTFEMNGQKFVGWTPKQVFNYVKSYVSGSPKEMSKKFDEMIYVFNDDEGFMNSEFDYVVNLDTNVKDQMVAPFANTSRSLAEKQFGAMEMVETTYGYHIIFNDGFAENIVNEANIDNISDEELLELLCSKTTRPDSNKTIFNYIYDKLSLDEGLYDNMTQSVLNSIKAGLVKDQIKIILYENAFEDLYK